ncbi:MAG: EAL domain-containing protein [Erythrobacter sp.]|nr:EAL domain-containing protein [Erythrobacter sp.]
MLARSATAAICADHDNRIVSWNKGAETLFGHRAQDAIGKSLSIIIPERMRAAHEAGAKRAVQAGHAGLAGKAIELPALHADGHEIPVDLTLSMWFEDGVPMFGALLRDVTDRSRAHKHLETLAHFDTLTGLPNRHALQTHMQDAIAAGACALMLLDLDGFKHVNDTLGHSQGDALLTQVAARLRAAVDDAHFVARLGGDEFAVLVGECGDPGVLHELADAIRTALVQPIELCGQSVFVDASIGIALAPDSAFSAEELLGNADLALYAAKAQGGRMRVFFTRAMQRDAERRHRMNTDLRGALERGEFELLYQPQVDLADGRLVGAEALLRWNHPQHGQLRPSVFIDALEHSPVAMEVGDWIIDSACDAAATFDRAGLGPIRVAANLFARQLRSGGLFAVVEAALDRHDLSPERLELEITESTALQDNIHQMRDLGRLKNLGVHIAFDDFGTGYASLSLLQKYPLTRLKVDRSFIARIDRSETDAAIVQAVVTMARTLGLDIIAEGVETAGQEAALKALSCHEAQGFLYGKPMPAAEVIARFSPVRSDERCTADVS